MDYRICRFGIASSHLIPLNRGYLMVDTGYPKDYGRFLNHLRQMGLKPADISHLFLTHAHNDHAGFAAKMKHEHGTKLIVNEKSLPYLTRGRGRMEELTVYPITARVKIGTAAFYWLQKDARYPSVQISEGDKVIRDDDDTLLNSLGLSAQILLTPGHTPDSMSVLMADGTAFVGDACMNYLRFLGSDYRPIFFTDEKQMYQSIRRLLKRGATKIVPAHGPAFSSDKLRAILKRGDVS